MNNTRKYAAFHTVFDGKNFGHLEDNVGCLMTQEHWLGLRKVMDELYEANNEDAIQRFNKDAVEYARIMAESRKAVLERQDYNKEEHHG